MIKRLILPLLLYIFAPDAIWNSTLEEDFQQIDEEFSGNIGVYVKYLEDDTVINYNTDRNWYLASTIKIPLAIAVLQKVEDGELKLDQELTLEEAYFVDGSGDLLWKEPGTSYTIEALIERMLRDSDSTATDMLLGLLGVNEFNEQVRSRIASDGIEHISTILQVRYDAYGEIHESAANLTNTDIIKLKGISPMSDRLNELLRILKIEKDDIKVGTIPDAFERYYKRNINSGQLQTMGQILENLYKGEYLNQKHTDLLIEIMKGVTTGDDRIKAGLPEGVEFAHKTGTQIGRSCNVGILFPPTEVEPVIVATCAEKYRSLNEAESAFEKVGRSLAQNW